MNTARRLRPLLLVACALLITTAASAEELALPPPQGYVNDFAHVIPAEQAQQMEQVLREFAKQSGVEIAVVTIDSLKGGDIDDQAVHLFEQWGIGRKGSDSGVLILAAIADRQARIEVGYGLEGAIPDAVAGRVLRETIFPSFRNGDYSGGLSAGIDALIQRIASERGIEFQPKLTTSGANQKPAETANPLVWLFRLILLIIAVAIFIKNPFLFLLLFGMGGRGGGISGGFGGGGFGGFGGGLSGGGGASGRW